MHWVEHILLGNYPDENNRLTVILYTCDWQNIGKEKPESFLRERLPAHLDVRYLWLDRPKIAGFWKTHWLWREALQQQNEKAMALIGTHLHDFIIRNQ
jgi:hypothetical protein